MKKSYLFKLLVFAVIAAFVTVTSCKDYDDDINRLDTELSGVKADYAAKIDALRSELNSAIDTKVNAVKADLTALQTKVTTLEAELAKAATKTELQAAIDAAKTEMLSKVVTLEAFNAYKSTTDAAILALQNKVTALETNSATKAELAALESALNTEISGVKTLITNLTGKVSTLETNYTNLSTTVATLGTDLGNLTTEVRTHISLVTSLLGIVDGKSTVLNQIQKDLSEQLKKITANSDSIDSVAIDLNTKYLELVEVDEELQRQITKNANDIIAINKYIEDTLKPKLEGIENDITNLKGRMTTAETNIGINTSNIFTLSKQLTGLTFIPTRGLPNEKTAKLYYFAGDYTADQVLMYRVSPSNSKLGTDFTVESLNYQITTRSVEDGSEKVDVVINPKGKYAVAGETDLQQGIKQFGDILYVPVKISGSAECSVFGNIDWWGNNYFFGVQRLNQNNFPANIVKTKTANVKYTNPQDRHDAANGLSLVLTASTNSIDKGKVSVKSTEQVNTELVPTQIKLAESRKGKGNQLLAENLTERLLNRTLEDAAEWANLNENNLPANDKNWNVLAWSGNQGQGGVWTPGEIDLYDYVSSFYYPQDGGDLSRANTVQGDPHRFLYAEFGKEFGKPYFDKPHYAKPVYEFEQMIYRDTNHNIVIGPEGGEGVTHTYVKLEGSKLTVLTNEIQNIRNKKIIIKVTQVNSDCEERQPVGYLVLKYSDSSMGVWPDVDYTIDLTSFPYYHKECQEEVNGAGEIPMYYTPLGAGSQATHKDALLGLFVADRFMSPINAPASYGLAGEINPGDVNVMLSGSLQLNGIGEHNMGNIYNIQTRDASVVTNSPKFTAAAYNHVNDAENKPATEVTAADAFKHVMIRYEYDNHSYIVYVDDQAPAGDYEITYKLENKENNTQHGNILYLTFKFKVALREITVEHDKNSVNWQADNKTIRVQHTRIHNSIHKHSKFLSDEGYRVDLKEAFIMKDGTVDIVTTTLPAIGGVNAGNAPGYRPKFEFIQDAKITAAGFKYVRDANNYLTRIEIGGNLAARIENDPADKFNYLYITFSKEGDLLYNYLMGNMHATNDMANHNTWTKWGKTELTNIDDMERLLPVRMVTDINAKCLPTGADKFPNGNYYYIDDFNIKFERALRFAFTTVELNDDQQFQLAPFDFFTKDEKNGIYRGLFDHAYYGANPPAGHVDHGYGNLVTSQVSWWNWTPYTFTNPMAQGEFYGVKSTPLFLKNFAETHVLPIAANQIPKWPLHPDYEPVAQVNYTGVAYELVEISTDGGKNWKKADKDYFVLAHDRRYFNVITIPYQEPGSSEYFEVMTAIWQGNQTAITSPIYFRVPVVNQTAFDNKYAPDAAGNYWMTFRDGHAKVKGYAVFKINPRP